MILSFGQEKVVVNMGVLKEDRLKISKRPIPVKFNTIYSEIPTEFKGFYIHKIYKDQLQS